MNILNRKSTVLAGLFIAALTATQTQAATSITAASVSSNEANLVRVCKALKSNSRIQLHKAVKRTHVSYREIAKGLVCNGKSAIDFAEMHNANKTAAILAKRARVADTAMLAKR